jgi:hypothetical protein
MHKTLMVRTTILPGHRIEISAPQFSEGDLVDVLVLRGATAPRRSILGFLQSLPPGPFQFPTAEDADLYPQQGRDAWGR